MRNGVEDHDWSLARDWSRGPRSMDRFWNRRWCSHTTTESNPFAFQKPHLFSFPLFKLFSQMSVPSSPTRFAAQEDDAVRNPSALPRTRTVAIVKNHALPHRLDIEPRISEAGFEVRETAPRRHV